MGQCTGFPIYACFFLNVSLLRSETLLAFSSSISEPSAEPAIVCAEPRGGKVDGFFFSFFLPLTQIFLVWLDLVTLLSCFFDLFFSLLLSSSFVSPILCDMG